MKRSILFIFFLYASFSLFAQYRVIGGNGIPLLAENDTRNKLEVYLLNGLDGSQISYTSSESGTHQWYQYKEKAIEATPIPSVQNGNTSFILNVEEGCGYFVGSPTSTQTSFVWIVDYSRYVPHFFNLETSEEADKCKSLKILADVEAEAINYYRPSGASDNLERIYHLSYNTQEWNETALTFLPKTENMEWKGIVSEIAIPAPLQNTTFTLTGDDFAEHFGMEQAIRSAEYQAIAIEIHAYPGPNKEHADNEIHKSGSALGGSAPIEYTFTAYANEPVAAFYIWQIQEIDSLSGNLTTLVRFPDKQLHYNFERDGNYLAQLEVFDSQSVCVDTTQVFPVSIGRSYIQIPNAFSPGSSIGVNDELKIAFTSILSFKASVYNRWGNLLFQWSDPTKGWDGRVGGKFVPTGTYYVVVEYTDSHKKKGHASQSVNILRTKE
jgi:gliding motility-associated-like protein